MSLRDEIQEAKRVWEKASWPIRGFIALSLFLNFGAIASLSDVVFAFKGALLDTVEFYRGMVVEPLRYLASCVKLDYSEFESNLVVLSLLYSASLSRITLVSSDAVDKRRQLLESGKDPGLSKFHSGDLLRMLNVGYPLFVILLMGLPTTSDISSPPLVYFIYVLLLQYFGYASIALGSSRKGHKARFFGPLGIALAFVFIAGAINAGLSR